MDVPFTPVLPKIKAAKGWVSDVKGEWHRADGIARLVINGGRVEAVFMDCSSTTLANYGADVESAEDFRSKTAQYITECALPYLSQ